MLLAYLQALLVHQNRLVCTGVDFLTAQVVWVLAGITIGKAFSVCHLVDNTISICVNRVGSLSQQNWNDPVVCTTLSLVINRQIFFVRLATPSRLSIHFWGGMGA
jgi:hypothetical protein